jgi:hypothetical protein
VHASFSVASSGLESEEFAAAESLANHMGLFLQKTNIIRDYLVGGWEVGVGSISIVYIGCSLMDMVAEVLQHAVCRVCLEAHLPDGQTPCHTYSPFSQLLAPLHGHGIIPCQSLISSHTHKEAAVMSPKQEALCAKMLAPGPVPWVSHESQLAQVPLQIMYTGT